MVNLRLFKKFLRLRLLSFSREMFNPFALYALVSPINNYLTRNVFLLFSLIFDEIPPFFQTSSCLVVSEPRVVSDERVVRLNRRE